MKNTVLVIGGAGYLGSVLVDKLLERKYPVTILDSFIYGKRSIEKYCNDSRVEIVEGDIRNIELVNAVMNNASSVILLAAVVGDPASASRPEQTVETNYLASQMIASACRLKGKNRFIYASTCSVYGIGNKTLDESAPLNPVSLYAKTKISSEQSILQLVDNNFSPTIMRMSTLYGFSPRMRFDLVVNTMTMTAYAENRINVFGGEQWRPLMHVKDAADAYIKVLEADIDIIKGKVYNVGSEEQNYKIKEVSEIIGKTISKSAGRDVPVNIEKTSMDARDYRVSFKKIRDELNFHVTHTIDEAAKEIYDSLKSGIIKDPKQKVYYNHYFDASEDLIG
ncbi:MAG: SDR family oxidoreductase [Ignavibacteriae bacterium]|nr:MAG: SDR family oxidoreductase [Ignavibacteriota bacterium]